MGNLSVPDDHDWVSIYQDSGIQWPVSGLDPKLTYVFRVKAINKFGSSDFSDLSRVLVIGDVTPTQGALQAGTGTSNNPHNRVRDKFCNDPSNTGAMISIVVAIFLVLCMVAVLFFVTLLRRPWDKKQMKGRESNYKALFCRISYGSSKSADPAGPAVEILLRSNPTYEKTPSRDELELLPKIKRSQIDLVRFIGENRHSDPWTFLTKSSLRRIRSLWRGIRRSLPSSGRRRRDQRISDDDNNSNDNDDSFVSTEAAKSGRENLEEGRG